MAGCLPELWGTFVVAITDGREDAIYEASELQSFALTCVTLARRYTEEVEGAGFGRVDHSTPLPLGAVNWFVQRTMTRVASKEESKRPQGAVVRKCILLGLAGSRVGDLSGAPSGVGSASGVPPDDTAVFTGTAAYSAQIMTAVQVTEAYLASRCRRSVSCFLNGVSGSASPDSMFRLLSEEACVRGPGACSARALHKATRTTAVVNRKRPAPAVV